MKECFWSDVFFTGTLNFSQTTLGQGAHKLAPVAQDVLLIRRTATPGEEISLDEFPRSPTEYIGETVPLALLGTSRGMLNTVKHQLGTSTALKEKSAPHSL
jgi:hypothetical protein